jgi:Domain of unknown function (DUF4430)
LTLRAVAALLLAVGVLAGCGQEQAGEGRASLWITRDRGGEVLRTAEVPAGISAMEALRREADVDTRYGGRFVQAIDGIKGSIGDQRDWFYFVNGYEADIGAADYRLHAGDVVWFDYRSWAEEMRVPVAVGAFPEPFLHGYGGKRRSAVVVARPGPVARRIASLVGGRLNGRRDGANVLVLVAGSVLRGRLSGGAGDPVTFYVGRKIAGRLARDPAFARFRYSIP